MKQRMLRPPMLDSQHMTPMSQAFQRGASTVALPQAVHPVQVAAMAFIRHSMLTDGTPTRGQQSLEWVSDGLRVASELITHVDSWV